MEKTLTYKVEREIGAHTLTIEVGKLAKQAAGSALVRYGDTLVLGTVVTAPPRTPLGFFPLTVDYREKMSAAGKFPGGFFKREGRPSTKEILSARLIDRPMRPLFQKGFMDEVQIQVMVLSTDSQTDPDTIGFVAAAAAVAVSGLPFNGPVAAVRVGRVSGEFVLNPERSQMEYSDLDLVVAGTPNAVNMIEVGSKEISEDAVFEAIRFAHENGVVPICEMLAQLKSLAGKPTTWTPPESNDALVQEIRKRVWNELREAKCIRTKLERNAAVKAIYDKTVEHYCPPDADKAEHEPGEIKAILEQIEEEFVRERILKEHVRPDGRKLDEVRPITCEVGWLPRNHGSALFSRGETQAMVTTTLGTASDEQIIDEMLEEYSKKFMLHYNFPPFSVGEVKRIMGPGRREIGHGALAERSLEAVLPSPEAFPYTIRLVSDILESNGSSSMATVCGGSLALMDAGVPISGTVAGISVGLVKEGDKHVCMVDIIGEEDHFGDMDFKVAGTRKGVTGIQLDIKIEGLPFAIIREALTMAHRARMHIIDIMERTLAAPRPEISSYAPRLITLKINPEKIGKLIGPGGKQIRAIQTESGAQIDIEDDGTVIISSVDSEKAKLAERLVLGLTEDIQLGKIYEGKVVGIRDFGAFLEIQAGQDGLCHISELDDQYVRSVTDVVRVGDVLRVKVIDIDEQGRIRLSRKAAKKEEEAAKGGAT